MRTTVMRTFPRRLAVPLAAALALALVAGACTRNGAAFESFQRVNSEREARGLSILTLDQTLINKAQDWADSMASRGRVGHSVLADGAGDNWRILGENVGWARSVGEMHSMFMNSPEHRANVVSGRYNRVGTGVAVVDGRYYVVQVFAG
jgi:uncharacterized protein YkwD